MTTPSEKDDEKDKVLIARESLYTLYQYACRTAGNMNLQHMIDAFNDVVAVFPEEEKPPTMDEIEWDNKEHYLAEARVLSAPDPHYVIGMLEPALSEHMLTTKQLIHGEEIPRGKYIRVFDEHSMFFMDADVLAPTGRKYTLIPKE